MNNDFNGVLRFECFELHAISGELLRAGVRIPIQFQPFKLLTYFALHPGQTISRETLRTHLWSRHTFVDFEAGLNFCVRQVRKALGEDARAPRILQTINRRGYRFMAEVKQEDAETPQFTAEANGIRVTLISLQSLATDGPAIKRLTELITQLLLTTCSNAERSMLGSTAGQTSAAAMHTAQTDSHATLQAVNARSVEVRIDRSHAGGQLIPALRVG
jgi:DNA-binding winged helix-turn-helix (wHTH) protein